jgi:hypothetical protein
LRRFLSCALGLRTRKRPARNDPPPPRVVCSGKAGKEDETMVFGIVLMLAFGVMIFEVAWLIGSSL